MAERAITAEWCGLTKTGISVKRMPTMPEWKDFGEQLFAWRRVIHFWLGDWAAMGPSLFGEDAETIIAYLAEKFEFAPATIVNDRRVMAAIPIERRRPSLSFAHHARVARLPAEDQVRYLSLAEQKGLTSEELGRHITGKTGPEMRDPLPLIYEAVSTSRRAQALTTGDAHESMTLAIENLEDAARRVAGKTRIRVKVRAPATAQG